MAESQIKSVVFLKALQERPKTVYDVGEFRFTTNRNSIGELVEYTRVASGSEAAKKARERLEAAERNKWEELRRICPPFADLPPLSWYEICWDREEVREFLLKYPWPYNCLSLISRARMAMGDTWYDWSDEAAGLSGRIHRIYEAGYYRLFEEVGFMAANSMLTNDDAHLVMEYLAQFNSMFPLKVDQFDEEEDEGGEDGEE